MPRPRIEAPPPERGQIWTDRIARSAGRAFTIERILNRGTRYAVVEARVLRDSDSTTALGAVSRVGNLVSISADRLRPTYTGYDLIWSPDSGWRCSARQSCPGHPSPQQVCQLLDATPDPVSLAVHQLLTTTEGRPRRLIGVRLHELLRR